MECAAGMSHSPPTTHRLYPLLYLLVLTTGALAIWLATTTRPNAHPDENIHVDAFCYFEQHAWPPPLNRDGLRYSPDGWSRVYSGEAVYILYGQLGRVLKPLIGEGGLLHPTPRLADGPRIYLPLLADSSTCVLDYRLYRLLNSLLWIATLAALITAGRRHRALLSLALLLCSLPQVVYLYAYANSDAWALSMSALLAAFALTRRSAGGLQHRDLLGMGLLTGLLLLAKPSQWIVLPLCYLIWLWSPRPDGQPPATPNLRRVVTQAGATLLIGFLIALPLKGLYPLAQGDYPRRLLEMREARARPDLRPSTLLDPANRPALQRNLSNTQLLREWLSTSLESFYGRFGYLEIRLPGWVYASAALLLLGGVGLSVAGPLRRRRDLSGQDRTLLAATLLFLLLPLPISLRSSWTALAAPDATAWLPVLLNPGPVVDIQPQGRFLYAALIPLALLLSRAAQESRRGRHIYVGLWTALLLLSHYALFSTFVVNGALR